MSTEAATLLARCDELGRDQRGPRPAHPSRGHAGPAPGLGARGRLDARRRPGRPHRPGRQPGRPLRRRGRADAAARLAPRLGGRRRPLRRAARGARRRWPWWSGCTPPAGGCRSPSRCSASATRRACATAPPTWARRCWRASFDPGWLERRDGDGVSLGEALAAVGGEPAADRRRGPRPGEPGRLDRGAHRAGPAARGAATCRSAWSSSIQGASRAVVTFRGRGRPRRARCRWTRRRDALVAAAEWVLAVEREGRARDGPGGHGRPARRASGRRQRDPGRGRGDARRPPRRRRASAAPRCRGAAGGRCRGDAGCDASSTTSRPWPATPRLRALLGDAVAAAGFERASSCRAAPATTRSSLSRVCPVAMLFVRCTDGISHNPAESVAEADVAVALDVLAGAVDRLAAG